MSNRPGGRKGNNWLWVPSEDEQLRAMLAAGEGVDAVAAKLGRTIDGVTNRAARLKIPTRRNRADYQQKRRERK